MVTQRLQIRRDMSGAAAAVGLVLLLFIDGDLVLNRVQKWMDRHKKRDQFDWFLFKKKKKK